MSFDAVSWIMNPFILLSLTAFTGMLLGRVRLGRFRLGGSGALFTGLFIGWKILGYAMGVGEGEKAYKAASSVVEAGVVDSLFFYLFLIVFVVSVGLLAARDIGKVIRIYGARFIALGLTITFVGAAGSYLMTVMSGSVSPFEVSGVYTGALTSSPGLAAALESAGREAEELAGRYGAMNEDERKDFLRILGEEGAPEDGAALSDRQKKVFVRSAEAGVGVGHSIGYPFGVIIVILAVNLLPKIFGIDVEREKELFALEMEGGSDGGDKAEEARETDFDMVGFVAACLFGYTIGQIRVFLGPLGYLSLGATGGALLGALLLGYIGRIGFVSFRMNGRILAIIRELALVLFLSTVGLRYGFKVVDAMTGTGAYLALVAVVVAAAALLAGLFLGRYAFGINWIILSGALCGGMTSTPGLGCCIDAIGSDDPAAGYGATYPFALLGMVFFSIILHKLPV